MTVNAFIIFFRPFLLAINYLLSTEKSVKKIQNSSGMMFYVRFCMYSYSRCVLSYIFWSNVIRQEFFINARLINMSQNYWY